VYTNRSSLPFTYVAVVYSGCRLCMSLSKLPLLESRIYKVFLSLYWTFPAVTVFNFIPSLSNLLFSLSTVAWGHIRNYELRKWNFNFILLENFFVRIWNIAPEWKLMSIKMTLSRVLCHLTLWFACGECSFLLKSCLYLCTLTIWVCLEHCRFAL
jgi:hypothetical protein